MIPGSPSSAEETIEAQRLVIEQLRDKILDHEDTLRSLQSQHDVLESFCFGLEQEHEKARRALESTKGELQASYDKLRALSEEQDDILANVKQGILTIGRDLAINAGYSRISEAMFERAPLAGIPFESLFDADPPMRVRIRRYLELSFAELHASPAMLERLNPVSEYPYVVTRPGGERLIKLFSFSFARVTLGRSSAARAPIAKVMVVVDDRTAEYELNRELARRAKAHAAEVEKAYRLVMLPPNVVQDFIREATQAIDLIERDGAERLASATRAAHSLKGNARALGLDDLASAAHRIEDLLEQGAGEEPLRAAIQAAKGEIEGGEQLFRRMLGVRAALRSVTEERAYGLEATLRGLLAREAEHAGKRVELRFSADLPRGLSPLLLSRIKNALVQLVRNGIAHGIEAVEDRRAAGKADVGSIEVRLWQEGAGLVVSCGDDGRGVDVEKLRAAAVARGAISPEAAERLDPTAALGLAFARGVSTRESPDQLSGRGVGMDVVKESVEATGGEALLESEPGRGVRVLLRFPHDGGEAATAPRESTHTSRTEDGERPVAP